MLIKEPIFEKKRRLQGLIGRGISKKDIAAELGISFTTVRSRIYNLYQKTEVQSRVGLLNAARKASDDISHTKV